MGVKREWIIWDDGWGWSRQVWSQLGGSCWRGKCVGKPILVPLTTSLYVPGKLADTENVIVDVGTGFYVEKVCGHVVLASSKQPSAMDSSNLSGTPLDLCVDCDGGFQGLTHYTEHKRCNEILWNKSGGFGVKSERSGGNYWWKEQESVTDRRWYEF